MIESKKGVSQIIATVLLISIVLVLGAMVLSFSMNYVNKQKEGTVGFSNNYDVKLSILGGLATLPPGAGEGTQSITLGVMRLDNEENMMQGLTGQANGPSGQTSNIKGVRFNFKDNKGGSYSYDDYDNPPVVTGYIYSYEITSADIEGTAPEEVTQISVRLLYGSDKATAILDEIEIN